MIRTTPLLIASLVAACGAGSRPADGEQAAAASGSGTAAAPTAAGPTAAAPTPAAFVESLLGVEPAGGRAKLPAAKLDPEIKRRLTAHFALLEEPIARAADPLYADHKRDFAMDAHRERVAWAAARHGDLSVVVGHRLWTSGRRGSVAVLFAVDGAEIAPLGAAVWSSDRPDGAPTLEAGDGVVCASVDFGERVGFEHVCARVDDRVVAARIDEHPVNREVDACVALRTQIAACAEDPAHRATIIDRFAAWQDDPPTLPMAWRDPGEARAACRAAIEQVPRDWHPVVDVLNPDEARDAYRTGGCAGLARTIQVGDPAG